ncbi:caspase domain-containing protein [Mycena maculata]|uniref:Caspase domain-containing protein n=1 Tax=Mycena maculata TaxID=230809 RepID=A0AAD7KGK1_9AGAR|nr:caspase domain-containing protein [Mycena maculata]
MTSRTIGRFIAEVGLRLAFHVPRRRALLIGIRSGFHIRRSDTSKTATSTSSGTGSAMTLYGPHDDVESLKVLLIVKFGYKESDVVVLIDDAAVEPNLQPTHANIMRELDQFMINQQPGDIFFFGYSGHSYHKKKPSGLAPTHSEKFIIPSDAGDCIQSTPDYSKVIFAKVLREKLVNRLLGGSRLTAVLDTCHSASLLDLKHCKCNRIGSWRSLLRRSVRRTRELFEVGKVENISQPSHPTLPRSASSVLSQHLRETVEYCSGYCPRPWAPGVIPVLCISACKDSQMVFENAEGTSLTRTFVDLLNETPQPSLSQLVRVCSKKSHDVAEQMKYAGEPDCSPWHPQVRSSPRSLRYLRNPHKQLSSLAPLVFCFLCCGTFGL